MYLFRALELYDGPKVTIIVGKGLLMKRYVLSKALLARNSKLLETQIAELDKSEKRLELKMEEETIAAFDMLVQMIYTGYTFPPKKSSTSTYYDVIRNRITHYLQFFKLAHKVELKCRASVQEITDYSSNAPDVLNAAIKDFTKVVRDSAVARNGYLLTENHLALAYDLPVGDRSRNIQTTLARALV